MTLASCWAASGEQLTTGAQHLSSTTLASTCQSSSTPWQLRTAAHLVLEPHQASYNTCAFFAHTPLDALRWHRWLHLCELVRQHGCVTACHTSTAKLVDASLLQQGLLCNLMQPLYRQSRLQDVVSCALHLVIHRDLVYIGHTIQKRPCLV